MKNRRALLFLASLCTVLVLGNLFASGVSGKKFSESFPASACPPTGVGMSSLVSTASGNTPFRNVAGKISSFKKIKSSRYQIASDPILIDGQQVTPVIWQSVPGSWAGSAICSSPQGEQWFVGGAGDITSKGRLLLVNSGMSEAIVDVAVWSESGVQTGKVISFPANSFTQIKLDALAPGQSKLTLRVIPRAGRVSAYMVDERGRGLRSLGGDLVSPASATSKDFVIAGIPHQIIKATPTSHILRILAPGGVSANVHVDLISKDGTFAPVGLDQRSIAPGVVTEIVLAPEIAATAFSLRVQSDQPVVAAVFSPLSLSGPRDFMWNTATPPLVPFTIAVTGLQPTLVFSGDEISLKIDARLSSGKVQSSRIAGQDIVIWKSPTNALSLMISSVSNGVYGAVIVTSTSGVGGFPLTPGSVLTRAAIPNSNISVINR
ncbi:MAG: DUF5719 family protein [Actinomycetes bacterium]